MIQLEPSEDMQYDLAKAVGSVVALALVLALFAFFIWLIVILEMPCLAYLSLFVIAGVGLAGIRVNRAIQRFLATRWHDLALSQLAEPTVSISHKPVTVGDSFTVTYRQSVHRPVNIERFTLQLVKRTRLIRHRTFARVADPSEERHEQIVQVVEREGQRCEPGDVYHQEVKLTIPQNSTPSLQVTNPVQRTERYEEWLVRPRLDLNAWLTFEEEYLITVGPNLSRT